MSENNNKSNNKIEEIIENLKTLNLEETSELVERFKSVFNIKGSNLNFGAEEKKDDKQVVKVDKVSVYITGWSNENRVKIIKKIKEIGKEIITAENSELVNSLNKGDEVKVKENIDIEEAKKIQEEFLSLKATVIYK